jgi:hypothetical protein
MSESTHVFNHARTTTSSTENIHTVIDPPSNLNEGSRRRQQAQQPRQLLSCTKCRERKVKVSSPRRRNNPLPFQAVFAQQRGLISRSVIVRNRAQLAAPEEHPKNAILSQKVATTHLFNNRMRFASFVPKTSVSRNGYARARFPSRTMSQIQLPRHNRTRASDQPARPRNVAQQDSGAFTALNGPIASILEVQD